jgi:predicted amidohydrolase YtcJ
MGVGIDNKTPNPPGGEIVRDRQGNPTGMLRETAQDSVREAVAQYRARRTPEVIEAELREQVKLAAQEAITNGITTFHDMGESFAIIDLLRRMADEGRFGYTWRYRSQVKSWGRDLHSIG